MRLYAGRLQALDFSLDLLHRDQVMLDVERGRRKQVRAADRDAA